jgi:nuclear pore complex protein Nup155
MKLLLLHVSEHQDSHLVISIWRFLFDKREPSLLPSSAVIDESLVGTVESLNEEFNAVSTLVENLGRKYYPSESAFPLGKFRCYSLG